MQSTSTLVAWIFILREWLGECYPLDQGKGQKNNIRPFIITIHTLYNLAVRCALIILMVKVCQTNRPKELAIFSSQPDIDKRIFI